MRKEERYRRREAEEDAVSSYWITLKKQRRYDILKDESTRPQSVGNSLWKRFCTCRNTDLAGKRWTCVLLSILVRYSSSRVSQEPNVENNCSEGRTEILRSRTMTATKTDVVVFWIITQWFGPLVGHWYFGGTYFSIFRVETFFFFAYCVKVSSILRCSNPLFVALTRTCSDRYLSVNRISRKVNALQTQLCDSTGVDIPSTQYMCCRK